MIMPHIAIGNDGLNLSLGHGLNFSQSHAYTFIA